MPKANARASVKIGQPVQDLQEKLAKFLCTNFSIILVPKFQTSAMICRDQTKFKAKTARALAAWSHYRFRQRLLHKLRNYPWCGIIIMDEAYTSKTCGMCG